MAQSDAGAAAATQESSADRVSPTLDVANSSKGEPIAEDAVKCFDGFYEHAYRLLFAFEDKYESITPPRLLTILKSGIVENEKVLKPEKGKGLLAYGYTQDIAPDLVKELKEKHGDSIDAFIQPRGDGTVSIVQTWTTSYNEAWKKNFREYTVNPSKENFEDLAAKEFHDAMVRLFGAGARSQQVKFAISSKRNDKPVYLGRGDKLMECLKSDSEVRNTLCIPKLLEDGFVATVERKDKESSEKAFHMSMDQMYALYTKEGYETMACCKPLEQFHAEATLGPLKATLEPLKEGPPVADTTPVENEATVDVPQEVEQQNRDSCWRRLRDFLPKV